MNEVKRYYCEALYESTQDGLVTEHPARMQAVYPAADFDRLAAHNAALEQQLNAVNVIGLAVLEDGQNCMKKLGQERTQNAALREVVDRAMAFTEAHNRYAVAKETAYEKRKANDPDSQMEIQILAVRRTAEMRHLFQVCMLSTLTPAAQENAPRKESEL